MDIKLKNLTKVFQGRENKNEEVRAVDNLDIVIPSGKLVGLLGPSGCGKSTTLYMIAGLLEPTTGQIFFDEEDVTELSPEKRGIGLVFQNYALYPHMTVLQNILFPLENMKVPKDEALQRAQKVAELVDIAGLLNRKPKQLSGGQQQRVAIARALVKEPRVLLLDEPLSNLDARLRLQTREEIKRIQRETGITTVFVTHDQEEAMSICDKMVVMKLGVVQQIGEPQAIYDDPDNLFVANFLGTPPINVFTGEIKNGGVYIGDEKIMDTDIADQKIYVGIRPEAFLYEEGDGVLSMNKDFIEVMGRDKSVVATHPNSTKPSVRLIIDADIQLPETKVLKFGLRKHKVFLFNRDTEMRLR